VRFCYATEDVGNDKPEPVPDSPGEAIWGFGFNLPTETAKVRTLAVLRSKTARAMYPSTSIS